MAQVYSRYLLYILTADLAHIKTIHLGWRLSLGLDMGEGDMLNLSFLLVRMLNKHDGGITDSFSADSFSAAVQLCIYLAVNVWQQLLSTNIFEQQLLQVHIFGLDDSLTFIQNANI